MRFSAREKKIIKLLEKQHLSASHRLDHLKKVSEFGVWLAKKYEASRDVVVAASLLHDLGRSDLKLRGKATALKASRLAVPMLKKCGYEMYEIKSITQAIAEHDQPKFRSKLVESRILKDCDYLDGFGARGILRCIMYAGETGGGISEALHRLGVKARQRIRGLEFRESKRLAWKLHRMTEVFLDELVKVGNLQDEDYEGKLIVLEGISGCGKDTQAKLLMEYLSRGNNSEDEIVLVNHPSDFMKKNVWRPWRKLVDDRASEMFFMMAERVRVTRDTILPALKAGKTVISTRSSISCWAYQADVWFVPGFVRYGFSFEPVADLVVYLDVGLKNALQRTDKRVKRGIEKDRGFFGSKQREQKVRFEKSLKYYPNVVRVDANGNEKQTFKKMIGKISSKI